MIETRPYGDTGMHVSSLGPGAGQLGEERVSDAEALLLGAIEAGVTLIDTAPSYGVSEARVGHVIVTLLVFAFGWLISSLVSRRRRGLASGTGGNFSAS